MVKKFIDKKKAATFAVVHRSQRDPLIADDNATPLVLVPVELPGSSRRLRNNAARERIVTGNEDFFDKVDQVAYEPNEEEGDDDDDDDIDDEMMASDDDNDDDEDETKKDKKEKQPKKPVTRTRTVVNANAGEAAKYGIMFDDTAYDYTKHLKEMGADPAAVFVPAPNSAAASSKPRKQDIEFRAPHTSTASSSTIMDRLALPAEVFASEYEEDVGVLNLAAPVRGPQPELGAEVLEVLEALEDDRYEGELDDDFLAELDASGDEVDEDGDSEWEHEGEWKPRRKGTANGEDDDDGDDDDEDDEEDYDGSDVSSVGVSALELEERKTTKLTQYSMTSSILPRSENLQLLDDRFEKLMEQYGDDDIGALGHEDPAVQGILEHEQFEDMFDVFLAEEKSLRGLKGVLDSSDRLMAKKGLVKVTPQMQANIDKETERVRRLQEREEAESGKKAPVVVVEVDEVPEANWDAETVLSTYSNLDNHPAMIREQGGRAKIRLDRRGFPVVVGSPAVPASAGPAAHATSAEAAAAKQAEAAQQQQGTDEAHEGDNDNNNDDGSASANDDDDHNSATPTASTVVSTVRSKNETPEEKRQRKQAVKEQRRARRVEKKTTKQAFATEKLRQEKDMRNRAVQAVTMVL